MKYKKQLRSIMAILTVVIIALFVILGTDKESKIESGNINNEALLEFKSIKEGTLKEDIKNKFGEPDACGNFGYADVYIIEGAQITINYTNDDAGKMVSEDVIINTNPRLTTSDIIELSKLGEALGWRDFEKYPYVETGSGLYIRVYEIDKDFTLMIGGAGSDSIPMYMNLSAKAEGDKLIDIRSAGVSEFVNKYSTKENKYKVVEDILLAKASRNKLGECATYGYKVLGEEIDGDSRKIYVLTTIGKYGFINGEFTKVSGSGVLPCVVTVKATGEPTIEEPKDGAYYIKSIKEMFPYKYESTALKAEDDELISKELKKQEIDMAKEYLKSIGREVEKYEIDSATFEEISQRTEIVPIVIE